MGVISLTSHFVASADYPEANPEIVLPEVLPPVGLDRPEQAICLMFGSSETRKTLTRLAQNAWRDKKKLFVISVEVEIGFIAPGANLLKLQDLPKTRHLNLESVGPDIQEAIAEVLLEELGSHEMEQIRDVLPSRFISGHPPLFNALLKDRRFSHIGAITFSESPGARSGAQKYTYLFDSKIVESIHCDGATALKIKFPKRLGAEGGSEPPSGPKAGRRTSAAQKKGTTKKGAKPAAKKGIVKRKSQRMMALAG